MKIGILTHPLVCNYGGILQALSFSHILKEKGHEVIMIDRRKDLPKHEILIKKFIDLLSATHLKRRTHIHAEQLRFIKNHFHRTNEIYGHSQMVNTIINERFDYIFIGSDQIWNPEFVHKSSMDYWGSFLKEVSVRTSFYGGSMWSKVWEYNNEDTTAIKELVKNFVGISARELSTQIVLEKNLGIKDVEYVLDPTLLHDKDFYNRYASSKIESSPYVFVYWLGCEDNLPNVGDIFPKHKIVKCNFGSPNENLSVEDWLSAIKNADVVFTNSFHGCALSIIYHKHFIPYAQYNGGEWDSRMLTLLHKFNMHDKMDDIYSIEDYDEIDKQISKLRIQSLEYIDNCLKQ